ncbi:hypothetical protein DNI29_21240 [Hymenobacter sediminis]|uniref:hypothetical protein n=1 Tax=Hymenobacter sediminis TaxID=2218621 RepID=UPI000DA67406|nr:hypothetical protein [Hymenobacter sediminis]RPD44656.1 hypothetical protein DNI29_21240 [Hymenobacter sediminis]
MKALATILISAIMGCTTAPNPVPIITQQQLDCLNKPTDYVKKSVASHKQTYYGMDQDITLFKTPEGRIIGYLLEQGECSTVLLQVPEQQLQQASDFIAAEVKKNYGPMFFTNQEQKVSFKYYLDTTPLREGKPAYLVAQAMN